MASDARADARAGRPGFRPVHPGRIVKRNIDALGTTIEAFAERICTSRQTVHAILAGRSAVTPDMAARLGRVFSTSPQFWLNMQAAHDVWEPERSRDIKRIRPFKVKTMTVTALVRQRSTGDAVPAPTMSAEKKRRKK